MSNNREEILFCIQYTNILLEVISDHLADKNCHHSIRSMMEDVQYLVEQQRERDRLEMRKDSRKLLD